MPRRARSESVKNEKEIAKKNTRRASAVKPPQKKAQKNARSQKRKVQEDGGEEESDEESEAYADDAESDDDDALSLDSDALDESDFDASKKSGRKRKRVSASGKIAIRKNGNSATASSRKSPVKKKGRKSKGGDESEDSEDDGLEIVGTVVDAPKTGRVPPGQISQNTLDFLKRLQDPECNDRTWFKLYEPVFRQAEKEWKDFIDAFTPLLMEADPQIPPLPPNDVAHRIYRDVRFSNDKTPYKTNFSASFSRSGRKGIFAHFKPGGSVFAAGTWQPGKNEIQTIRNNILRSPRRLRQLISAPEFVELFGKPKPHPKGERQNIFGYEDELKVAPKGVDKNHKDIDLLKCRSFIVVQRFTDEEVIDPNFKEELKRLAALLRPFVHTLNDMMTIPAEDAESSGEEDGSEDND